MSTLVAGFGNIFLSDDGVGPAVLRMLAGEHLGGDVRVRDFGTGGIHLALEMLAGYERVIIVDALSRNDVPGTVFAVDCSKEEVLGAGPPDAHAMTVADVLALYKQLRAQSGLKRDPEIIVVGCVPQCLEEGMDLSEPVRAALPACVDLVRRLAHEPTGTGVPS